MPGTETKSVWRYFDQLEFLRDCCHDRRFVDSNIGIFILIHSYYGNRCGFIYDFIRSVARGMVISCVRASLAAVYADKQKKIRLGNT